MWEDTPYMESPHRGVKGCFLSSFLLIDSLLANGESSKGGYAVGVLTLLLSLPSALLTLLLS